MDISKRGLDLLYHFEGRHKKLSDGRYKAYRCPANVPTIYAGLTHGVKDGMIVTEEEGEAMLKRELWRYEDAVERLVKVPMNQSQFDALVLLVFNIGIGAFERSTLLRLLNEGKYQTVPAQMARWVNGGGKQLLGLVRRRAAEAALFMEPVGPEEADEEPSMPQSVDTPVVPTTIAVVKESTTAKVTAVGGIGLSLTQGWEWLFGVAKDASTAAVVDQKSLDGLSALWSYYGVSAGKIGMVIAMAALIGAFIRAVQRGKAA